MSTINQLLAKADGLHRAGRLNDAEACCREALQADDADAPAHSLLGLILGAQGRLEEAAESFRRAIACRPDSARARNNLGVALERLGRLEESADALRDAVARMPDYVEAHNNLGVTLEKLGLFGEAAASCRRAIELNPEYAPAHNCLGVVLQRAGKLDEAASAFRRALQLVPEAAETRSNLAAVLEAQGKLDEALLLLQHAVELDPQSVEPYVNLSLVLEKHGRLDEALGPLHRARELDPNCAAVHVNLGLIFERQGRLEEAAMSYRRALAADPQCAEAHMNHALTLLRDGDFADGWREFEWRFQCAGAVKQTRMHPQWTGEPLEGRTILLWEEQGFGDSLQFVRFASLVKNRGATVIVECRPELAGLVASCPAVDQVLGVGSPPVKPDVQLPLLSLPAVLGIALESIPATVPYLFPNAGLVEKWKDELGSVPGFKVGIVWQGNPAYPGNRFRSIPLEYFAPLAGVVGVRLFSLQIGTGREQLAPSPLVGEITDLADRIRDFQDTAAIMANLDVVITCDSAPAHLAGALGVPVWVALPLVADWRWMHARSDSPWYPTMRLYRQSKLGDWQGLFERIARDLAALVRQRR